MIIVRNLVRSKQDPARSGRTVLVHPDPADTSAGVLPRRDRSSATPASLADSTRRVAVQHRRGNIFQAEPDRAGGCYGKSDTSRAEMFQVRLTHPLIDPYRLLWAPQATSTSTVPQREPPLCEPVKLPADGRANDASDAAAHARPRLTSAEVVSDLDLAQRVAVVIAARPGRSSALRSGSYPCGGRS